MIGRTLPSFLGAVKTLEIKSSCGVSTSLTIPLSMKSEIKGRISSRFFPLTARHSSGVDVRGGKELKLSLRPVVIMLVTVVSPSFSHCNFRSLNFSSQTFCFSGSSERTPGSEKSLASLLDYGPELYLSYGEMGYYMYY